MTLDSKAILTGAAFIGTILVGMIMAVSVTTNAAGGLAAMVPLIIFILSLLAFIKPSVGIYGLAALVVWVDEFKRLAVYFGGAYSVTVIQVLAMPFIVLGALNIGFFINILFGKVKIDLTSIFIYIAAALIGVTVFAATDGSFFSKVQRAASIAGYLSLIPIACAYLKSFDEWRRFFAFQVIVALPAAAWAIKQYYFGFDQIEWEYARSGLSPVHYSQMFVEKPRVFGFFGSASALGCTAIYCTFSWWHSIRYKNKRIFWFLSAIVLSWVLVVSTQRTSLVYPLIAFSAAYTFRTKALTIAAYTSGFTVLILGIFNAKYLLDEGLENTNRFLASLASGSWAETVLTVNTFSDRLRGWERLGKLESWSLLGTGKQKFSAVTAGFDVSSSDYNHDIINKILMNYGLVGVFSILILGIILLKTLHSIIFVHSDKQDRNDAAFALALSLPVIFMSFFGGDNFSANPINLQIWTAFVGVLVARKASLQHKASLSSRNGIHSI